MSGGRNLPTIFAALLGAFGLAQLVPYGRNHANPPDGAVVSWDSPTTRTLAERTCFDCHSNHTQWPAYASIAPISWRIQNHVDEGREKLNFTAFDPATKEVAEAAGEAGETVTKGEMPPRDYLLLHPEARLTVAEQRALVAGLDATFSAYRKPGKARESIGTAAGGRRQNDGDRD